MIVLIAEAKTMGKCDGLVGSAPALERAALLKTQAQIFEAPEEAPLAGGPEGGFADGALPEVAGFAGGALREAEGFAGGAEGALAGVPVGEAAADGVMRRLAGMGVDEVAREVKVSAKLARGILEMAYEFPNKGVGERAVEAYTGVVFRALDYASLPVEARLWVDRNVRIVSSLYGWLRPGDVVKEYRLDFGVRMSPDDTAMAAYWKRGVTVELVRELERRGERTVLNLLPGDAARCVDWKLVKRFAKVYKVDFEEVTEGGVTRTPNSNRLKTLRGHLLREIAMRGIEDVEELKSLSTDELLPQGCPKYADHILFYC